MATDDQILIVGAGLAGSLMGVLLAGRDYDVTIFEKRSDPRKTNLVGGRSINLALSTRGIQALSRAGLRQDVMKLTIPMAGRMIHDIDGRTTLQPYGKDDTEVIYSISRSGLNELLLDACERTGKVSLVFETACSDIDDAERTISTVGASGDAEKYMGQLIFGCDGAGSVVRQRLAADGKVKSESRFLEHGYRELSIPADAEGNHRLDKNALHIWPRETFMLIALPNLDGSFTVTLFMPHQGDVSFEAFPDAPSGRDLFQRFFPDALELMPDFNQDYGHNPVGQLGTVYCSPWSSSGSTMLLGDAAHAIVPFFGQGMNCSFEDCSIFLDAMAAAGPEWESILRSYEVIRKPDADAIAQMALENYEEMRDHVADPRFVLKKQLSLELERRFPSRFIPRYSMVTFHRIPYAIAQQRGKIQSDILVTLTQEIDDITGVDWAAAERLVEVLTPLGISDGLSRA